MALLSPLVERAVELSAQWHDATYRKGGWREPAFEGAGRPARVPVSAHVTAVALLVQRAGWDDVTVAAAILHDVLEDCSRHRKVFGYDRLRDVMGVEVAELVRWVSEDRLGQDGKPAGWETRKERYLERLREAPVEAIAISLADKLHNLWTMNQTMRSGLDPFRPSSSRRALSRGPGPQRWFFSSVLEIAESHEDGRLVGLRNELREALAVFDGLIERQEPRGGSTRSIPSRQ